MLHSSKLSFKILQQPDELAIYFADTSYYNPSQVISNLILQIISPFDPAPKEVKFYPKGITIINSNLLGITNDWDGGHLQVLPDGIYTAKLSMCLDTQFYYEYTWLRTSQLECKYNKALLKLDISQCDECFDPKKLDQLKRANIYIQGVKANMEVANVKQAKALYRAADKIIDNIIQCECSEKKHF